LAKRPICPGMTVDLIEEETAALLRELGDIIANHRYFLSPRISALKAIRAKFCSQPAHPAPLPPLRNYEPPSKGKWRPRRG